MELSKNTDETFRKNGNSGVLSCKSYFATVGEVFGKRGVVRPKNESAQDSFSGIADNNRLNVTWMLGYGLCRLVEYELPKKEQYTVRKLALSLWPNFDSRARRSEDLFLESSSKLS